MQIKTFKFFMSNTARFNTLYHRKSDEWDTEANCVTPVSPASEIDDTINEFIADKEVINIIINDYVSHRHNNGRSDIVERTYTIMFN